MSKIFIGIISICCNSLLLTSKQLIYTLDQPETTLINWCVISSEGMLAIFMTKASSQTINHTYKRLPGYNWNIVEVALNTINLNLNIKGTVRVKSTIGTSSLIDMNQMHLQGRIQDLWLGVAWIGEGSGDRLRSPAGPWSSGDFRNYRHIYLNDNFEPTTPFLSDQKNLILSLNFVG